MLKLEHISKWFDRGGPNERLALDDISLEVERGQFVTIIGSNGAGKSTLLGTIAGDVSPEQGRISLDGKDMTTEPAHRRARVIGRLFQNPMRGTSPHMTIGENLALAAGKGSWLSRERAGQREEHRARLALLGMGLEDRMDQPVGLLSGGQRQALTLLMATIRTPKLLLLDEHTAALDPGTAEKVLNLTRDLTAREGLTTLMVTHDMEQALRMGDRTIMMDHGRIVLDVRGEERRNMTVEDLLARFRTGTGRRLNTDRVLLSI